MNSKRMYRLWLTLAFAAIYVVWGTSYLASLYALKGIPPFVISSLRYLIAGGILMAVALSKRLSFPSWKDVRVLGLSGVLMLVGGSGLIVVAEQYISSGSAAVIVATEPLWFVLLDRPRWNLYFKNWAIIAGLVVGFSGIALFTFFAPSPASPQIADYQLPATLLVLLSCTLWVLGTLFSARRIEKTTFTLWHPTIQLLATGLFSSLVAVVNGEWSNFVPSRVPINAWGGLAFLIVFGSIIAYQAFVWLVTVQPPAIVSTHTFVNPVIAVLMGWLLANEQVNGLQVVSLGIALAGVMMTQLNKQQVEDKPEIVRA